MSPNNLLFQIPTGCQASGFQRQCMNLHRLPFSQKFSLLSEHCLPSQPFRQSLWEAIIWSWHHSSLLPSHAQASDSFPSSTRLHRLHHPPGMLVRSIWVLTFLGSIYLICYQHVYRLWGSQSLRPLSLTLCSGLGRLHSLTQAGITVSVLFISF